MNENSFCNTSFCYVWEMTEAKPEEEKHEISSLGSKRYAYPKNKSCILKIVLTNSYQNTIL